MSGKNHRDYLPLEGLIVLDNMQSFNSNLISQNIPKEKRFELIQQEAQRQLNSLQNSKTIQNAKQKELSQFDQNLTKALNYNPKDKEPSK